MPDAAINILVGVVIAAVSSWTTVRLSLRRFRTEKMWEKKVEAYERVSDALHHSKAFSDAHMTARMEGRELSEDYEESLRARANAAHTEIEKAVDIGSFIFSEEASQRLKKYGEEVKELSQSQYWEEYLEGDLAATESCLTDLLKIAKHDIRA